MECLVTVLALAMNQFLEGKIDNSFGFAPEECTSLSLARHSIFFEASLRDEIKNVTWEHIPHTSRKVISVFNYFHFHIFLMSTAGRYMVWQRLQNKYELGLSFKCS